MGNSTSIAAQKGRAFVLKVSDGTSPTSFVTASGLRASGVNINGNPVDITTKSSGGWRELLPDGGIKTVDFSGSGIWDSGSAQLKALQAAALAGGSLIEAKIVSGAGDGFVGTFAVPTFNRNAPHDNAETYDVTLQSHGPVYYFSAGG